MLFRSYGRNPASSWVCDDIGMLLPIGPLGWDPATSWVCADIGMLYADIGMVLPIDGGIETFRLLLYGN